MYEKYCTHEEIVKTLCPYKIGETYILQKDLCDKDGVLHKGSIVTITDIELNEFFPILKLLKKDLSNYVAEGHIFTYTLCGDGHTFSCCFENEFVENKYKSPLRISIYKKEKTKLITISILSFIIGLSLFILTLLSVFPRIVYIPAVIGLIFGLYLFGDVMTNGLDQKFYFYDKTKYENVLK